MSSERTEKINEMIIRSVHLEANGWQITWKHKCEHCGKPNTFPVYSTLVNCGHCASDFVMDEPTLLQSKG